MILILREEFEVKKEEDGWTNSAKNVCKIQQEVELTGTRGKMEKSWTLGAHLDQMDPENSQVFILGRTSDKQEHQKV